MNPGIRFVWLALLLEALLLRDVEAQSRFIKNEFPHDFPQSLPWKNRFYVGMDLGAGFVKLSQNNLEDNRTARFSMAFYGGYKLFPWLRAGINLSGWLFEPYGYAFVYTYDPAQGISISNTFLQLEVFPFKRFNLYLNLAGGYSKYINNHPDANNARGFGALAGLGYEKDIFRRLGLSVKINYAFGKFDDMVIASTTSLTNQHYDVLECSIGIAYH